MHKHLWLAMLGIACAVSAGCHPLTTPGADSGGGQGPVSCGSTTCVEGTVCCNASCGICTPPGNVCIQIACDPGNTGASCAATTCPVGATCVETRGGAVCMAPEENPCNLVLCAANTTCQVIQGEASCVPSSGASDGSALIGAADAGDSSTSVRDPNGAGSCAVTLCPPDTYCDDISGTAQCIKSPSCEGSSCEPGQHCELKQVQCIRAPCPPLPTCVADTSAETDPCAAVRCRAGTHCEAKQVQCIRAPCPPIAECVPDAAGVKCGKNTCGAGTFCCNASCGTCAPKNGACTQQFCE